MKATLSDMEPEVRMSAFEFQRIIERYNLVSDFASKACVNHPDLEFHEVVVKPKTKDIHVIFKNDKEQKFISITLNYIWDSVENALETVKDALKVVELEKQKDKSNG